MTNLDNRFNEKFGMFYMEGNIKDDNFVVDKKGSQIVASDGIKAFIHQEIDKIKLEKKERSYQETTKRHLNYNDGYNQAVDDLEELKKGL